MGVSSPPVWKPCGVPPSSHQGYLCASAAASYPFAAAQAQNQRETPAFLEGPQPSLLLGHAGTAPARRAHSQLGTLDSPAVLKERGVSEPSVAQGLTPTVKDSLVARGTNQLASAMNLCKNWGKATECEDATEANRKRKAAMAVAPGRRDKSLATLAYELVRMYGHEGGEIDIDEAYSIMSSKWKKRRLYDVICVCQCLRVVERSARARFIWRGASTEQVQRAVSNIILRQKAGFHHPLVQGRPDKIRSRVTPPEDPPVPVTGLAYLCQQFVLLIRERELKGHTEPMRFEDVTEQLCERVGSSDAKTLLRRIYDIVNVLEALGLAKRSTSIPRGVLWTGPSLDVPEPELKPGEALPSWPGIAISKRKHGLRATRKFSTTIASPKCGSFLLALYRIELDAEWQTPRLYTMIWSLQKALIELEQSLQEDADGEPDLEPVRSAIEGMRQCILVGGDRENQAAPEVRSELETLKRQIADAQSISALQTALQDLGRLIRSNRPPATIARKRSPSFIAKAQGGTMGLPPRSALPSIAERVGSAKLAKAVARLNALSGARPLSDVELLVHAIDEVEAVEADEETDDEAEDEEGDEEAEGEDEEDMDEEEAELDVETCETESALDAGNSPQHLKKARVLSPADAMGDDRGNEDKVAKSPQGRSTHISAGEHSSSDDALSLLGFAAKCTSSASLLKCIEPTEPPASASSAPTEAPIPASAKTPAKPPAPTPAETRVRDPAQAPAKAPVQAPLSTIVSLIEAPARATPSRESPWQVGAVPASALPLVRDEANDAPNPSSFPLSAPAVAFHQDNLLGHTSVKMSDLLSMFARQLHQLGRHVDAARMEHLSRDYKGGLVAYEAAMYALSNMVGRQAVMDAAQAMITQQGNEDTIQHVETHLPCLTSQPSPNGGGMQPPAPYRNPSCVSTPAPCGYTPSPYLQPYAGAPHGSYATGNQYRPQYPLSTMSFQFSQAVEQHQYQFQSRLPQYAQTAPQAHAQLGLLYPRPQYPTTAHPFVQYAQPQHPPPPYPQQHLPQYVPVMPPGFYMR